MMESLPAQTRGCDMKYSHATITENPILQHNLVMEHPNLTNKVSGVKNVSIYGWGVGISL